MRPPAGRRNPRRVNVSYPARTGRNLSPSEIAGFAGRSQVIEITDSEIRRFRRIVCLQQLGLAFRSPFSASPPGSAAAVHVPSVGLIMA
jgi:hypothetical protein